METARFQIVGGVRTGANLDPSWPVVEPVAMDGRDVPWFGWRLLSRNHRDLARSPAVYASPQACVEAVERARTAVLGASTVLVRNARTGRWTWVLEAADGTVVATSSRGYLRRRECHDCVAQVLALAPVAIAPEPQDALAARPARRH